MDSDKMKGNSNLRGGEYFYPPLLLVKNSKYCKSGGLQDKVTFY